MRFLIETDWKKASQQMILNTRTDMSLQKRLSAVNAVALGRERNLMDTSDLTAVRILRTRTSAA